MALRGRLSIPVPATGSDRMRARGKFLFAGEDKVLVRGVSYGAFRPGPDGEEYHDLCQVERDFARMAENGINTVRIPHTMPPRALLDIALRHGLHVMVGLSAEQYVGYLTDRRHAPDVDGLVRRRVEAVAGHPALLCYALGNEVPASTARWLGRRRLERYLRRLYGVVKSADQDAIVTYVNYPSTEYLQLPFLDVVCFNVYLEDRSRLEAYLARLHNVAGDRPLIISELGLDSLRNGEDVQAHMLDWQVRTAFGSGCAGVVVFAWTDEWYRAGADVADWRFGLTDEARRPKPALASVRKAFADVPFPPDLSWPRISVVVCSRNGGRTIRDCLEGLRRLRYPDYEVIVVDDGSTDDTAAIARDFGVQVISTANRGLSCARNTGMAAATGEIVAYLDDDARPDSDWLTCLASSFRCPDYAAVGGPNIAPEDDGLTAQSVARAPGGPTHVLLSDREAEHMPGCNLAVRRACLEAVGGFDRRFRVAGDDVDLCWRLSEAGWKLGFNPAAVVWHHPRRTVRGFLKQQYGYGKAEGMLERKWPEQFNREGHPTWTGRVYGGSAARLVPTPGRIYHGRWCSAPFQRLYQPAPSALWSLLPDAYLVLLILALVVGQGLGWPPLAPALPLLGLLACLLAAPAVLVAATTPFPGARDSKVGRLRRRSLLALLVLLQPVARQLGRQRHRLATSWPGSGLAVPRPRSSAVWTRSWRALDERLTALFAALQARGVCVRRGGDYDRWDLQVHAGILVAVRLLMDVEDHGAGHQLVRWRSWLNWSAPGPRLVLLLVALSTAAASLQLWPAIAALGAASLVLLGLAVRDGAAATWALLQALRDVVREEA
jgi:O-antigen biosynthesis protein